MRNNRLFLKSTHLVHPYTPHQVGTPLENSGTTWGVRYTRLTSTEDQGSPDFLREGYISYSATVQGPNIFHNVFFRVMLHSTNSRQHIFQFIIFSLLAKCVLRPGKMASQVGCGPWAAVWRTLIWTMKRSGDSTHKWSESNAEQLRFNYVDTDAIF